MSKSEIPQLISISQERQRDLASPLVVSAVVVDSSIDEMEIDGPSYHDAMDLDSPSYQRQVQEVNAVAGPSGERLTNAAHRPSWKAGDNLPAVGFAMQQQPPMGDPLGRIVSLVSREQHVARRSVPRCPTAKTVSPPKMLSPTARHLLTLQDRSLGKGGVAAEEVSNNKRRQETSCDDELVTRAPVAVRAYELATCAGRRILGLVTPLMRIFMRRAPQAQITAVVVARGTKRRCCLRSDLEEEVDGSLSPHIVGNFAGVPSTSKRCAAASEPIADLFAEAGRRVEAVERTSLDRRVGRVFQNHTAAFRTPVSGSKRLRRQNTFVERPTARRSIIKSTVIPPADLVPKRFNVVDYPDLSRISEASHEPTSIIEQEHVTSPHLSTDNIDASFDQDQLLAGTPITQAPAAEEEEVALFSTPFERDQALTGTPTAQTDYTAPDTTTREFGAARDTALQVPFTQNSSAQDTSATEPPTQHAATQYSTVLSAQNEPPARTLHTAARVRLPLPTPPSSYRPLPRRRQVLASSRLAKPGLWNLNVDHQRDRKEEEDRKDEHIDMLTKRARALVLMTPQERATNEGHQRYVKTIQERHEKAAAAKKAIADAEDARREALRHQYLAKIERTRAEKEAEDRFQAAREQEEALAVLLAQQAEDERIRKILEESDRRIFKNDQLVTEPTDDMRKALDSKMTTQGNNVIVTKTVNGTEIDKASLARVLGGSGTAAWLSDATINAWLLALVTAMNEARGWKKGAAESAPYAAYNSNWVTQVKNRGGGSLKRWTSKLGIKNGRLDECELIFLPICNGMHWTLAVIHGKDKTIEYLDSLGGQGQQHIAAIRSVLEEELGEHYRAPEWHVPRTRSQHQDNGDDCGVFTCFNALAAARELPYNKVTAKEMPRARTLMAAILIHGGFTGDARLA